MAMIIQNLQNEIRAAIGSAMLRIDVAARMAEKEEWTNTVEELREIEQRLVALYREQEMD